MRNLILKIKLVAVILLLLNFTVSAQRKVKNVRFNINNVSTWVSNDGKMDGWINSSSGFIYPKGSNLSVIFLSGFVWGGKINGEVKVGGSTYNSGLFGGRILDNGTAEDSNLPSVRPFRVRRDFRKVSLQDEAVDEGVTEDEIYEKYEKDWNEWPAEYGAPFEDKNSNGIYEPEIDIPGEPGADQTIWFVCNDLDAEQTKSLYGSTPIGIEAQVSIYGYRNVPLYNSVVFKKYVLINKSNNKIEDMFVGIWSDPDVGDATDDFVGCDTTLNMMYAYNGEDYDASYGDNVPAVGFKIIQGPKTNNKFLNMTSFAALLKSHPDYGDPYLGEYQSGTLVLNNYFHGKVLDGSHTFQSSTGEIVSKFMFSGNPLNNEGWIDGDYWVPGDRRMLMSSGPFEMSPGDTQTVIFAQLAAGYIGNVDRLKSITLLKDNSKALELNLFSLFKLSNPDAEANSLHNNVILKWQKTNEDYNDSLFSFQGYNIYQLPRINSPKEEYVRIKTFDKIDGIKIISEEEYNSENNNYDLVVKQNGSDSGIERYFVVEKDYINNTPVRNGTPYYFVVGSYFVGDPEFKTFNNYETFSEPIKVIPHNPNPGIRYESEIGDSIYALHARGSAQADVNIIVVDPTEVTGNEYEIRFRKNNENKIIWDLENITENETVLTNQTNIIGSDDYVIVDGIRIIITEEEAQKITEEDLYRFTTPKVIYDEELAKIDVEKINVFPNPYYGYNPMETQKLGNFVMINHLPDKAVIRVFNLAGQLVRTLRKENTEQFYLWDLQNEHQLLVASGLYILHIEMPDLGKVKVLKLAVILGTEVPDFY